MSILNNKTILITGGTGTFGHKFTEMCLKEHKVKKLIIYSRDEMKQWEMAKLYENDSRLRFFLGDVRDKDRVCRALDNVDIVIHAAASKIVPSAEYNPFECIKTNVIGAMNVIDAAIDKGVKKVVALSTDKASSPINLYGASKLTADKLFIAGNSYSGGKSTCFSIVRYGNVMGSRGSVIPYFYSLREKNIFPITSKKMTRFMISAEEGVNLVLFSIKDMTGGEIYVKKIPSIKVLDIAKAISSKAKIKIIGLRSGEKLHEQMIGEEDSETTYEYNDYFKILPKLNNWHLDKKRIKKGVLVKPGFTYRSDKNDDWMTSKDISKWINKNITFLKID